MKILLFVILITFVVINSKLSSYNIDTSRITISGFSV